MAESQPVEDLWNVSHYKQPTRPKGTLANIPMPDTTGLPQRSSGQAVWSELFLDPRVGPTQYQAAGLMLQQEEQLLRNDNVQLSVCDPLIWTADSDGLYIHKKITVASLKQTNLQQDNLELISQISFM